MQEQPSSGGPEQPDEVEALRAVQSDIRAARDELRGVADGIRAALAADDALSREAASE
ncbi:hypothetical protein EV646_103252 [Kribbella antiqua]|uniref:Uncharacterized protein n=1 Tax=Kribbella antiqua TaxID=2512217 RepID=A0A4R2IV71_9ACTN|nr:hypothetical protein [Kribbella antiqua]TCO49274.1 hypothetical protein EV646_103252 [Kribbella antiqua]